MSEITLKTVNVSEKGQISIPREIRILLGIKKGDRLVLNAKNKKLLIQKATSMAKQMEDSFDPLTKLSERTAKKLWDSKDDEIWNNF